MGLWITTRQLLLRQDAKSSHTKSQQSGELGLLTGSIDIHLVTQCIITGVKMYTSRQTASERIVDTLEFFPHNYQMSQLSSTDRLLMAPRSSLRQRRG
jgi:hypothetical protein